MSDTAFSLAGTEEHQAARMLCCVLSFSNLQQESSNASKIIAFSRQWISNLPPIGSAFVKSSPLSRVSIRVQSVWAAPLFVQCPDIPQRQSPRCARRSQSVLDISASVSVCLLAGRVMTVNKAGNKRALVSRAADAGRVRQWVSRQQQDKGLQWHLWVSQWETQSWPLSDFSNWQL